MWITQGISLPPSAKSKIHYKDYTCITLHSLVSRENRQCICLEVYKNCVVFIRIRERKRKKMDEIGTIIIYTVPKPVNQGV